MIKFQSRIDIPKDFTGKCQTESTGAIRYFVNGKRHRLDGPAVEFPDGTSYWYVDGEFYLKEQFDALPEVIMYRAGLGIFL